MPVLNSRVVLKSIEISKRNSEETLCFSATLYIDGKKVGLVKNSGRGGPMEYCPWGPEKLVDEIAKQELGATYTYRGKEFPNTQERLINQLLEDYQTMEQAKNCFKGKVCGRSPRGAVATVNIKTDVTNPVLREGLMKTYGFTEIFTTVEQVFDALRAQEVALRKKLYGE